MYFRSLRRPALVGLSLAILLVLQLVTATLYTAQAQTGLPFTREEVTINLGGGVTTKGEFNFPLTGRAPYPLVMFIQGSGATDRDEGGQEADGSVSRTFETISAQLASLGVATFRYDKRGVCKTPTGGALCNVQVYATKTRQILLNDAKRAYALATADPRIDRARTGVLGHSEGSFLAPQLAKSFPQVKSLALMGTALSLHDAGYWQTVTRPLRGIGRYDANEDNALGLDEIPFSDAAAYALFAAYVGYDDIFYDFEGSLENLQFVGINPLLDRNGDGKLQFFSELFPVYREFYDVLFNWRGQEAFYARYADPLLVPLFEAALPGLDSIWLDSYNDEPQDGNARDILALTSRPAIGMFNGTYDALTPTSSVLKLYGKTVAGGYYNNRLQLYPKLSHFLSPTENELYLFYSSQILPKPAADMAHWLAGRLDRPNRFVDCGENCVVNLPASLQSLTALKDLKTKDLVEHQHFVQKYLKEGKIVRR